MIGARTRRILTYNTYRPLDAVSVLLYLRTLGVVDRLLGGIDRQWQARECGDGNLNLVFIVEGPSGAALVKQALPYVRMVGESWPLSVRRNFFEHVALLEHARWAAEFVPAVYHIDDGMALTVMELLTPHMVLRSAFMSGRLFTHVGRHLGLFLARTLFNTSDLGLSGIEKKERVGAFLTNTAMCQITEKLIFDEPYFSAPMNRHTSPQLDSLTAELTRDADLKIAAQEMKWQFVNQPECLIHGDLHTGSVMVLEEDTRIIDPEFAFYGPMGFDVGVLIANFLMAYFSQPGHASRAGERNEFGSYLLAQLTILWTTFTSEFSRLWHDRDLRPDGNLYNHQLSVDSPGFSTRALARRLQKIWNDALGFAGCEIIRRIVGLAHVADFDSIADPDRRAACERRAIRLARQLLVERDQFVSVAQLTTSASLHRC